MTGVGMHGSTYTYAHLSAWFRKMCCEHDVLKDHPAGFSSFTTNLIYFMSLLVIFFNTHSDFVD